MTLNVATVFASSASFAGVDAFGSLYSTDMDANFL
jgi:hypothetical protein